MTTLTSPTDSTQACMPLSSTHTDRTPMPWRTIGICYVGWAFDFYDLALFSFIVTLVGHDFHLSAGQEAWLLGTGLGASGVGGILFGWLADRYGRKKTM